MTDNHSAKSTSTGHEGGAGGRARLDSKHSGHSAQAAAEKDLEMLDTPPATAGPAAGASIGASPLPYQYGFWSPEIAQERKVYIVGLIRVTVTIILVIWAFVSIYWGSLWQAGNLTSNLNGWVINRDSAAPGTIGLSIQNALLGSNNALQAHLTWQIIDPSNYPTQAELDHAIAVDEKAWIAVEIRANATAVLEQARTNGDASYDPTTVVSLVYSEARNNIASGIHTGITRGVLLPAIARVSAQLAGSYLPTISGNAAAVQALATAPQTIANPVGMATRNLRPFDQQVATAPTFVGLIYLVILAFNVSMANFAFRGAIQPHLRLSSYIRLRLIAPVITYFFISWFFAMLNLPFKVHFDLAFGKAGFVVFWCAVFTGMCVLGLATEAALSLVGPQFMGFFLVMFIIINVSGANLPIELQPSFYRYSYAMPFYSLKQAFLMVIFNTGRHVDLIKYFGILWAWLLVELCTIPIWTWLDRRKDQKIRWAKE